MKKGTCEFCGKTNTPLYDAGVMYLCALCSNDGEVDFFEDEEDDE